ncbi:MAG TPA: DUF6279 family lipoprotein [Burkholderiales bacterium]|nr:DUF6279 family lipoprotein [Burkholderiales bacterium]
MRAVFALVVVALLAGCSGVRLAYDNLDTFIRWRALQFVDVQGEQADEFDERIARFLRWHRSNALPKYARDAEDAARRLSRGLAREDLVWGYDLFVAHGRESLRVAADQVAPMLDRLTAEQVRHIEQRLAEENRNFARRYLRGSERERREQRAKRIVERLEDWLGTLSKAQIEAVSQYSARAPLIDEMRERDSKRLQAEVLAIIRAREARKRLAERVVDWDKGREPAYVAARAANVHEFGTMLLEVDRLATREQRGRALSELRRYADDFRALAARPS